MLIPAIFIEPLFNGLKIALGIRGYIYRVFFLLWIYIFIQEKYKKYCNAQPCPALFSTYFFYC